MGRGLATMTISALAPLSAVLLGITAVLLMVSRDWRVSVSALGAQYLGAFLLIALVWPLEYAVIKLVAGWIAAAVLGMSLMERAEVWEREMVYGFSVILFRIFLAGFVALVILSLAPGAADWFVFATREQILAGFLLIGLGLFHLGLTVQPVRVIFGLLTVFSGFEILYATMEVSLLVNAFLAVITLGLALVGAYFLAIPNAEAEA
jgi:hypothetical protein